MIFDRDTRTDDREDANLDGYDQDPADRADEVDETDVPAVHAPYDATTRDTVITSDEPVDTVGADEHVSTDDFADDEVLDDEDEDDDELDDVDDEAAVVTDADAGTDQNIVDGEVVDDNDPDADLTAAPVPSESEFSTPPVAAERDTDTEYVDTDETPGYDGATDVTPTEPELAAAETQQFEPQSSDVEPAGAEPTAEHTDLLPGAVEAAAPAVGWSDEDANGFRDRWRDVQLRFVDDPRGAAAEAGTLVGEAVDKLTAALAAQRSELDSWQSQEGDDTEIFRMAVRRYRDLLDKVLAS